MVRDAMVQFKKCRGAIFFSDQFVFVPSVLQEARHQLTADLQNKMDALGIDMSCLSLTIKSPQISLKTNPTRIPSG